MILYFFTEGAPRRAPAIRARLGPLACPGGCCPPRAASPVFLRSFGGLMAQKKSTKSFASFGLRLIWIFCKSKIGQKQQLALGTMSIG